MPNGKSKINKGHLGNASQFFVAGELCRRGYSAVVTLGNTPNVDVLYSNHEGTKFVHIQVKTFPKGDRWCMVGKKAETDFGKTFFWVLTGLPRHNAPLTGRGLRKASGDVKNSDATIVYFIIPSKVMAKEISEAYRKLLATPTAKRRQRKEIDMRTAPIPPQVGQAGWSTAKFENRWDLIDKALKGRPDAKAGRFAIHVT